MAFKREGTDTGLLQDLQKRRVSEILVSHIPEDEALLLTNGKYSCTVCSHRPVVDTIEMLALHRKGKRHLISLTKHLIDKKLKEREQQKRLQEVALMSGAAATSFGQSKPLGSAKAKATKKAPRPKLMKAAPYSSCSKKKGSHQETTDAKGGVQAKTSSASENAENPLVKAYIKRSQKKNSFAALVEESKRTSTTPSSSAPPSGVSGDERVGAKAASVKPVGQHKKPASTEPKKELSEEEAREKAKANYFLNLRMSGWRLDRDGKWVKDENVEFDSDEDEPPPFDKAVP